MGVPEHFYSQSGVLARHEGMILLVTTQKGHWTIPKGVVEPNLTPAQSAAQEAFEEGGVEGTVRESPVGTFDYEKWGGVCRVEVFEMEVSKIHETWPESKVRQRRWVTLEKAAEEVNLKPLRAMIRSLVSPRGG